MSQAEEKQQQPSQQQAVQQQQQHPTQQQQSAPAQAAVAPNGHAKTTVPKLAPAPVPQQTPWKAPVIDPAEARANLEAVDAAHSQRHSKNAAVQRAREANKQVAASVPSAAAGSPAQGSASAGLAPKRATTGKEKWIPFTPVIPPSSSGTSSSGSSTRSRQNKRQSASFRQRRTGNSQGDRSGNSTGSNSSGSNNSDKRKLGSQSQANGGRNNGAGHPRSAPRAAANSRSDRPQQAEQGSNSSSSRGSQEPPVPAVEKLQVNDVAEGDVPISEEGLASTSFNAQSNGSSSAGSNPNSNRNMHDRRTQQHARQNFVPRNQNGPRKPRDNMRFGGPNKMPYYPGGYMASQMGFIPMQAMQMSAAPVPAVVPAVSNPKDLQMAYLVGQVDYYFSVENLCKDTFLRKNMNDEGLVPISVIANFARVKVLTTDLSLVAEACAQAPNIEVIGSKARAAINHHLWVFPEANRLPLGLDNGLESAQANPIPPFSSESSVPEPKFHVEQAVPFIPRGASESSN